MDLGISGRSAIVGGGSSGLGRACAERLAEAGCRLVIWARGADALEATARSLRERHGVEVHTVVADASDPGAAGTVAAAATDLLGSVDIVVLNAGGPPTADPTATEPDAWRSALQQLTITPIDLATRLRGAGWSVLFTPEVEIVHEIAVSTGRDILEALAEGKGPRETRFILGYAGWGPGQLESEMARDDWLTAPAEPSLVFSDTLDDVWERAIESAGLSL